MSLACDFRELFTGRDDVYGLGVGRVVHAKPTIEHYADHLRGCDSGIGIFPLRDDGTVRFAAIDLDEPNFELARALQKLIPGTSWIERSRSGNAHVWAFFKGDAPAWAARAVLRFALEAFDRRDVEIFPKQDELRAGGVGNYINLPYHGDDRPVLYGGLVDTQWGQPMFKDEWVGEALRKRQDPAAWERRARQVGGCPPSERESDSEWGQAAVLHECATYIIRNRFDNPLVPGHRAQVLFHLSCMLQNYRDMSEAEARELVHEVNEAGTEPAPRYEVDRQFNNARDGQFTSTGCDDPVMAPYVRDDCPIAAGEPGR